MFNLYRRLPSFPGKTTIGERLISIASPNSGTTSLKYFSMNLDIKDRIQRRMYLKGQHEPESEKVILDFFKGSKIFYDIGANVGYFSLLFLSKNPEATVYSFEPNTSNVKKFEENMSLNSFSQFEIINECVSDKDNQNVTFSVPPDGESGWGRITTGPSQKDWKVIQSKTISLDQYSHSKPIPDVIKIDVEGNEFKVLQGAQRLLQSHSPKLCIELNEPCLQQFSTSSTEIITFLKSLGYQCYYIDHLGSLYKTDYPIENYKYLNYFFTK